MSTNRENVPEGPAMAKTDEIEWRRICPVRGRQKIILDATLLFKTFHLH